MHKNRMIQLAQISQRSDRIGSKLKVPLMMSSNQSQFDVFHNKLDKFISNTQQANSLKNQYKKTVNPSKEKQVTNKINTVLLQNQNMVQPLEEQVKRIDTKYKQKVQQGDNSNYYKVAAITKKTRDAISDFKRTQQSFSNGVKDTIRRHATIIQGDITEQQLEDVINSPQKGQQMLQAKLLNSPSVQLESAVSDIIDKYRDILRLEKNMNECAQMTRQLAFLVQQQGQKLNNVEDAIFQTGDYMQKAEDDLEKAKQSHKSSRNKMCCIIMLLLVAIGAILIPVLITQLG